MSAPTSSMYRMPLFTLARMPGSNACNSTAKIEVTALKAAYAQTSLKVWKSHLRVIFNTAARLPKNNDAGSFPV
eukprot:5172837-Amphidinium_carterae.1